MHNIRSVFSGSQANLEHIASNDDNVSHHSGTTNSSFSILDDDVRMPQSTLTMPSVPMPVRRQAEPLTGVATKKIFITKCALKLLNNEVDQLTSRQTIDQAMNDFHRLYLTNGLANSLQSNYVNYSAFLNGAFISAWDLSTSGFVGNSYALPNIKTGTFE